MPFFYQCIEEIRQGDRVSYHGESRGIKFVAEQSAGDPGIDWHVKEFGGGVMIIEPKLFANVFVHDIENDEDLFVIARREPKAIN